MPDVDLERGESPDLTEEPEEPVLQQLKKYIRQNATRGNIIKFSLLCLLGVGVAVGLILLARSGLLQKAIEALESLGAWGVVVLGVALAISALPLVPGYAILLIGGGYIWKWWAFIPGIIGPNVGSFISFMMLRKCLRPWMEKRMAGNTRVAMLDEAIGLNAFKIVLLIRLTPIPIHLVTMMFSATKVALKPYLLGTVIGLLLEQGLLIYVGTTVGNITQIGEFTWTPSYIALFVVQIVVVIGVLVTVVLVGRRTYRQMMAKLAERRRMHLADGIGADDDDARKTEAVGLLAYEDRGLEDGEDEQQQQQLKQSLEMRELPSSDSTRTATD